MRIALTFAAVTLVVWPAVQPQTQQPVFRSGVDYVSVDVVVTDSNDKPITDLTKDDFEIIERGKPQTITDFQFVSVPLPARSGGPVTPLGPPADVVTNAAPSKDSRLFVLVVDDLHILESDLIDTKKVMTEFIRALAPDDEVAIVFVGRSNLSQNFTRDRGLLLRTVERTREALGFALDALGKTNASNVVYGDTRVILQYARSADYTLRNVAMAMAGSTQSRRAILYVTAGSLSPTVVNPSSRYPSDHDYIQEAYEAARRAGVPIYTIDPRGQALPNDAVRGGIGAISMQATSENSAPGNSSYTMIAANIRQQQSRLAEIAIATGGRHFTNQSDLTRAVREMVAENGSYYVLGYYPSPFEADGRFHAFDIKVKRPGVRVRARQGYVASGSAPITSDLKPMLDGAMATGVNVSALQMRATVAPLLPGAKGMMTAVTVELTYPARPDGSRQLDDELRLSVMALDPDAKAKATAERALRFQGTASESGPTTIVIHEAIELPSQQLILRIGVAAKALGKAGTVQVSVEVPKPSEGRLQLSGVVMAPEGRSAPALNADAIGAVVPFQPATTRIFSATDTVRVFGRVLWRSRDAATVTIGVKGIPAKTLQPALQTSSENGGQIAVFDGKVPLAGLAPGAYVFEITARLKSGRPVVREVPFEIR